MIFSKLSEQFDQPENRLYSEKLSLQAKKVVLRDLISGNVGEQGIRFPANLLVRALSAGSKRSHPYRPNPFGQWPAREAITLFYKKGGLQIPPEQILLTPGTSLAYSYLFQALADPGDEILCPQPNYPLFNMIAETAHVRITSYSLRAGKRWTIDMNSLEAARTDRTRAVVVISPHNPTGAVASVAELRTLSGWASRHSLPLIADEVFSPFLFTAEPLPRPASTSAPLVLTLNGFSKMLALPGMKLGWIAVTGDASLVKKMMTTLEMISDTFLPVNEAVQNAVPMLLDEGQTFLTRYQNEVNRRTQIAIKKLSKIKGIQFVPPEGGFYITLALDTKEEESICWEMLKQHHTVIHPGFFYDLEGSHLIFSTVHRPVEFQQGLKALQPLLLA